MREEIISRLIIFFTITISILLDARSPLRPRDPLMPELITCWPGESKTYHLRDYCLERHALFQKFDKQYFMDHLLPDDCIPYRLEPDKCVMGSHLKDLVEELLVELSHQAKKYKHFKILKDSDFNTRVVSGLIIFRFKNYPFVLKLFIKTPETFARPFSEGLNPRFFFRMGGGINRHLSGFTRIKNLEEIDKKIDASPYWSALIDTPRKWFLLPKNPRWIELLGKNIGPGPELKTEIPAVYGIIADFIENDASFSLMNSEDRQIALDFAHYLDNRVDAHVDNFMVEKSTGITVLIDTEHFPTMVGLKGKFHYDNYTQWYARLSGKCAKDIFLRTKQQRRNLQTHPTNELHPCFPECACS